ncbi:hypothetical protein DPQ26_18360 [Bacillus sp. E25]|nr:hypothetical protein DOS87_18330 [Bacillus sp. CR71]AXR26017.1 hypothetical protein DPQ26_18360 [Bacillus sp. E25]PDZ91852.1 hypothetical protein CON47_10030 [Bacillus thuringiensis]TKH83930.1 hypothetical protein FC688_07775 [Bacillus cereus]TKI18188.1 hypothetical protein FC683_29735 [Bacillus cereus]
MREHNLIFSTRSKQKDNYHIYIITYFWLIWNIISINKQYIYIEKFITNLVKTQLNFTQKFTFI